MLSPQTISGRSGIIWILIFMIPLVFASMIHDSYKTFFQIQDSRRLLNTHWLNDFLSGNLVSFCTCIVPLAFKLLLHTDSVSSFVLSRYWVFVTGINIKHQAEEDTGKASWLPAPNASITDRGFWEHAPRENFWKLDSRKRHILHSMDRTLLIYMFILLSFPLSLVFHDSPAEVQRFIIP